MSAIQPTSSLDIASYMRKLGEQAKAAASELARATRGDKDRALKAIAHSIRKNASAILSANEIDVRAAQQAGVEPALIDRLRLDDARIEAMALGCEQVAGLADPVGELSDLKIQPSGIQVGKMRVPLGVIGIVYESRPNVTVDAAILCLKSGNACILRGGSDAFHSNQAIASCVEEGLKSSALSPYCVQVVATADRSAVGELITSQEFVDVIIPRGGKSLIERISKDATVPTIKHLDGVCHVYIDEHADLAMAEAIAINAKTHRYGVCNAMETLVVHSVIVEEALARLVPQYVGLGVELRACSKTLASVKAGTASALNPATESDWSAEYLAPILAIKTVNSANEAIAHINQYGSAHTDAVVTNNHVIAMKFLREVDSASVMINASTRFADGLEYGLGAEIGISTDRLHVRGPVGLEGLTNQKFVVFGNGHVRG